MCSSLRNESSGQICSSTKLRVRSPPYHCRRCLPSRGSLYGGASELRGVVAWLACLTLSMHQSPQDGACGGCTSSSDAMAQASTLLHLRKLKRGTWQHMRCLHDLGMAHTFRTAVPLTSAWPHPNAPLNATCQRKPKDVTWDCRNCGIAQDCRVTWGHIGQGVQTGSTARRGLQVPTL